jgi:hypothetical protein
MLIVLGIFIGLPSLYYSYVGSHPQRPVVTPENVRAYIQTWLKDQPYFVDDQSTNYVANSIFALVLTNRWNEESVLVRQARDNSRFIEISTRLKPLPEQEQTMAELPSAEIKDVVDKVLLAMTLRERIETGYTRVPLRISIIENIRIEPMTEESFNGGVSDVIKAVTAAREIFFKELGNVRKSHLPQATPKVSGQDRVMGKGNVPTAFAPNGIAIAGGNVQNPTVNNYGTPLPTLSFSEEVVPDRPVPTLRIHVKTDRPAQGLIVGARFSDEIQTVGPDNSSDPDYPKLVGAKLQQLTWGGPLVEQDGTKIPYSLGFIVEIPAYVLPAMELVFTVTSKVPVHVLDLGAMRTGAPPKPQ